MNKKEAVEIIKNCLPLLKENFGVVKLGLFGSVVRNDISDDSDIDIAVELEEDFKTMKNFLGLNRQLEELFHMKVDLGIESALKPMARHLIEKEIIYIH